MKSLKILQNIILGIPALFILLGSCNSSVNKKSGNMGQKQTSTEGSYGYDVAFFKERKIPTIELKSPDSKACVLLIPGYQGRVMTSSANGQQGQSFGWINYKHIRSGEISKQFNPVGGEERLWLGPEGGSFSIFFAEGAEQVYSNWAVPGVLDIGDFKVASSSQSSASFIKNAILKNAAGTEFKIAFERTVTLLEPESLASVFRIEVPAGLDIVAYRSDNSIKNVGEQSWTKEKGLLSIWMLCMFNPSPTTTVFIPYKTEAEGVIVNDEYFGKVPSDRLVVQNGTIFFKIDGKLRSKIGLPPERAKGICGSYDSAKGVLTLLWCPVPGQPREYVNSQWGKQENPYQGDAINSYNDGPVEDGSIMGPFYEIETSSPAAKLNPQESLTHSQVVAHIQGDEEKIATVVQQLFNLNLRDITTRF